MGSDTDSFYFWWSTVWTVVGTLVTRLSFLLALIARYKPAWFSFFDAKSLLAAPVRIENRQRPDDLEAISTNVWTLMTASVPSGVSMLEASRDLLSELLTEQRLLITADTEAHSESLTEQRSFMSAVGKIQREIQELQTDLQTSTAVRLEILSKIQKRTRASDDPGSTGQLPPVDSVGRTCAIDLA